MICMAEAILSFLNTSVNISLSSLVFPDKKP